MKAIAITHKGMEDIAATEIKELIGADAAAEDSVLIFNAKPEDLCLLCYKAQSLSRVLAFLGEFEANADFGVSSENLKEVADKADFVEWTKEKFMVECRREGEHGFTSHEFMKKASGLISKKTNAKVDFKTPDIIFYILISGKKGYFGVDVAGFDLSKREYKVFGHPSSIKGAIGYALVRLSEYDKKKIFLDPFMDSGVVAIEAALFASNFPVNYYRRDEFSFLHLKPFSGIDFKKFFEKVSKKTAKAEVHGFDSSMLNLQNAKKNAKIAGINKFISFSRLNTEWLDTKFSRGKTGCIATNPPQPSKFSRDIDKLYNEFFYQAEYILNKKGRIALIAKSPEFVEASAKKRGFEVESARKISSGKEELNVLVLKHKNL